MDQFYAFGMNIISNITLLFLGFILSCKNQRKHYLPTYYENFFYSLDYLVLYTSFNTVSSVSMHWNFDVFCTKSA